MPTTWMRIRQAARFWWVVALCAVVGAVVAALASGGTHTSYTARSALIVSSGGWAPEQDGVMVQGYITYFNDPGFQERLLRQAGVAPDLTVLARAAASSPIMLIEATASTAADAQEGAARLAEDFRNEMNDVRAEGNEEAVARLQAELDRALAAAPTGDGAAGQQINSLQERLLQLQSDQTNQLQLLQSDGGTTENRSDPVGVIALGLGGGLVVGAWLALALGSARALVRTAADLEAATGLRPLVQISDTSSPQWSAGLRRLAGVLTGADVAPTTIALVAPETRSARTTNAAAARALAAEMGRLGMRVAWIRVRMLEEDGAATVAPRRLAAALATARQTVDAIVVDGGTTADPAAVVAAASACDATVAVVERGPVRTTGATDLVDLLAQVGVKPFGAVLTVPAPADRADVDLPGGGGTAAVGTYVDDDPQREGVRRQ